MPGGVWLEIEGYGETIVKRQLLRFSDQLMAPAAALETAATILRHAVEEQFDTEGGYASGGWPALAQSTVDHKAKYDLDPRILRATGTLHASLTRKFDPQHIEHLSVDSLIFGSTVSYGIFHQSSRPRTKIPFRPPIALTEATKRGMVREMQRALMVGLRPSHETSLSEFV